MVSDGSVPSSPAGSKRVSIAVLPRELADVPGHRLLQTEVVEDDRVQHARLRADAVERSLREAAHFVEIGCQARVPRVRIPGARVRSPGRNRPG